MASGMPMVSSQEIGRQHEERVEKFLQALGMTYERRKRCKTDQGASLELDFRLAPAKSRPAVVIECKTFGVAAKNPSDSRRRKAQESLYFLVQVRRYCAETRRARIVIVTGQEDFLREQVQLLTAEIGPDFHVVSIEAADQLRKLLE